MIDKLKGALESALDKLPSLPIKAMWAIYLYAAFLFAALLIYITMILCEWHRTGAEPIRDMKDFCEVLFSSAAVTAASFCARYLVDKDQNGTPDEAEKEEGRRRL